ncbi:MAG: hypothetical protein O3B47_04755, partial [bacterium]|nr:hypothetical protein [bacterium]
QVSEEKRLLNRIRNFLIPEVYAGCTGSWACGVTTTRCDCSVGGTSCSNPGGTCNAIGTCVCGQPFCFQTTLNQCSGSSAAACTAGTCGDCTTANGCTWTNPTSAPPTNTPVPPSTPTPTTGGVRYSCDQLVPGICATANVPSGGETSCASGTSPKVTTNPATGQITFDFECSGSYTWSYWRESNPGQGLAIVRSFTEGSGNIISRINNGESSGTITDPDGITNGATYYFVPYCAAESTRDLGEARNVGCYRDATISAPTPTPACTAYNYFDNPADNSTFTNGQTYLLNGWARFCKGSTGVARNRVDIHRCDAGTWNNCNGVAGNVTSTNRPDTAGYCGSGNPNDNGWTYSWTPSLPVGNYTIRTAAISDSSSGCGTSWSEKNITIINPPIPTLTPIPPCTIQGYKVMMPANRNEPPASVQTITFDGAATNANQPYFQPVSAGSHTVSAPQIPGYYVGYTSCENDTSCHTGTPTFGDAAIINCPAGGYNDLWWHYYEIGTPLSGGGWVKLKDTSYYGVASIIDFIIPNVAQAYDLEDTTRPYFDIGNAGVIYALGTIDFGIGPNVKSSANKWNRKGYSRDYYNLTNDTNHLTSFIQYAKARKSVKIITDIANAEAGKINILQTGNLDITQANANVLPDKSVLIVQGNVNFANRPGNNHVFNPTTPTSRSIAIISTGTITVDEAYTQLNGIFIAQGYDFGSSDTPLKISGNLISATQVSFARERQDTFEKPTFFIVFKPQMYIDLIPLLSTIIREGREIQ